jgi:hypothetical protein
MKKTLLIATTILSSITTAAYATRAPENVAVRKLSPIVIEMAALQESPVRVSSGEPQPLESFVVQPKPVVEKSRFDGQPAPKGKSLAVAMAEKPITKTENTSRSFIQVDSNDGSGAPPKVVRFGEKNTEVSQNTTSQVFMTKTSATPSMKPPLMQPLGAPPMIGLSQDSYLVPPNANAQQLASLAPASGTPKAVVPAKVSMSLFTGNMVGRNPQGKIDKASVSMGNLTYFSVVENISGQYLVHRWEKDGKVLFDKPFAVNATPSSAWSSVELGTSMIGKLTVKVLDQSGKMLTSEMIEVVQ